MGKHKKTILACGALATAGIPFLWWQNNGIELTGITIRDSRIPHAFDGYRIAHISDLHNKEFGKEQERLLSLTREAAPDIIVITGDLINDGRDISHAVEFVKGAVSIAPVYYVAGNHEYHSGRYGELSEKMRRFGVHILDDDWTLLQKHGEEIVLLGALDPRFTSGYFRYDSVDFRFSQALKKLSEAGKDRYSILLSHRPEMMETYASRGFHLVFAGHAHGGQVRIPKKGGLIAVGQGLFPQYTSGLYYERGTFMVVSRGLGNSSCPVRIFNRPEIIIAVLSSQ